MDCQLFWEEVKNQNQPKTQNSTCCGANTRNRQAVNDLQDKEATSGELATKTVKAVTEERERERERDARGAESRSSLGISYEKAAAEAINKVKQDLATKEIEQMLKQ